jgi:hypothetical protein
MNPKASLLLAATLIAGTAQATCYSIYKADGSLLLESSTSPVNLSLQIGDAVTEKFGTGATMTVSDLHVYCRDASERLQHPPRSLADALVQEERKKALAVRKDAAPEGTKTAAK